MERRKSISDKDIIAALKETHGLVSVAAKRLGIDRGTIHRRARKVSKNGKPSRIAEAITDCRAYLGDVAEQQLFQAISQGRPWAITMYLKTQCKDRGYVERQDVSAQVAHSGSLGIRILEDDDWYGNADRLDHAAQAPPGSGTDTPGTV